MADIRGQSPARHRRRFPAPSAVPAHPAAGLAVRLGPAGQAAVAPGAVAALAVVTLVGRRSRGEVAEADHPAASGADQGEAGDHDDRPPLSL